MNWQIVIGLNLIIFGFGHIILKLVTERIPKAKGLCLQFAICALLSAGYYFIKNGFNFPIGLLAVSAVGFFVAFGAYSQWQVIDFHMSRTAVFYPFSNLITVLLAALILNEVSEWNPRLAGGIILCFIALFLFMSAKDKNQKEKFRTRNDRKKWLFYLLLMIIVFGTADFLIKCFSFKISHSQFLFTWYFGAFLGSLLIVKVSKEEKISFSNKFILLVPFLSLAILGNMATNYWAFQLTLASNVVPVRAIGITILPIFIGWIVFKEWKELTKKEVSAFFLGIIGVLLILL